MLSINSIIGSVKSLTLPIILFIEFIRFIKLKVHKVCRPLWDILLTVARAAESKIVNYHVLHQILYTAKAAIVSNPV